MSEQTPEKKPFQYDLRLLHVGLFYLIILVLTLSDRYQVQRLQMDAFEHKFTKQDVKRLQDQVLDLWIKVKKLEKEQKTTDDILLEHVEKTP